MKLYVYLLVVLGIVAMVAASNGLRECNTGCFNATKVVKQQCVDSFKNGTAECRSTYMGCMGEAKEIYTVSSQTATDKDAYRAGKEGCREGYQTCKETEIDEKKACLVDVREKELACKQSCRNQTITVVHDCKEDALQQERQCRDNSTTCVATAEETYQTSDHSKEQKEILKTSREQCKTVKDTCVGQAETARKNCKED